MAFATRRDGKMEELKSKIAEIADDYLRYHDLMTGEEVADKIISLIAKTAPVADVPCNEGLCRLPIEAIEVEDDWQLVQDHVEDENWAEVSPALNRMREKMLKLEAHAFAKRVLSA
jgi:hypothetical protein